MARKERLTSGRTRRAIKIGGLASQVGSSYFWTSLRLPFLNADDRQRELANTHIRNALRLVEGSTQLRGAFMKLVQMLSMREDILPLQVIDVLRVTQSNVPPMDYGMISEQIRREFGKQPEQLFASFEQDAFAAASLGQVHRARLKNGELAAVKIQYPGVADTVKQDLQNLKLLLRALQPLLRDVMRQKIDTNEIFGELQTRLREELDYIREARNLALFSRLFADDPEIVVPTVVSELSSRRVLTMTYVEGYRLADVIGPGSDLKLRRWLALKYHALVWRQILEFGVLHTDPHPGNYLVTFHPKLAILDFGSIRHFPEIVHKAHLRFAHGLVARDFGEITAALVTLGYLDADQDPAPMRQVVEILFEPALVDRAFDPAEYDSVRRAAAVGEIALAHKLYRSPAHGIFLLRALVGLEGIIRQIGCKENYRRMFCAAVARAER